MLALPQEVAGQVACKRGVLVVDARTLDTGTRSSPLSGAHPDIEPVGWRGILVVPPIH